VNIEELRADIFKLFDLRIDKDDPIWAFLYANREVIRNLEDILEVSKEENREYHKTLKLELEEFRKVAKDSVHTAIQQFDFRLDEFQRNIGRIERYNENISTQQEKFNIETRQELDRKIENINSIFNSNIMAIENRMNAIIDGIDYTHFSSSVEREISDVVKNSLQEVRAGVSINKKGLENLRELKDDNESAVRRLESRVSSLTTLAIFQTVLFGASLTLLGIVYFSQGTLQFEKNSPKTHVETGEAK
jgi:gas vesicle protein